MVLRALVDAGGGATVEVQPPSQEVMVEVVLYMDVDVISPEVWVDVTGQMVV